MTVHRAKEEVARLGDEICERDIRRRTEKEKQMSNVTNKFPPGWDEGHVRGIIEHYDSLTDDGWATEIEAAFEDKSHTVMVIPNDLVPTVRALLSQAPNPAPASPGGW